MIINEDILRRDTVRLITQIDQQIDEVARHADVAGIDPHKLRDANGSWVMIPLLQAKAQAYNTLVVLQMGMKK